MNREYEKKDIYIKILVAVALIFLMVIGDQINLFEVLLKDENYVETEGIIEKIGRYPLRYAVVKYKYESNTYTDRVNASIWDDEGNKVKILTKDGHATRNSIIIRENTIFVFIASAIYIIHKSRRLRVIKSLN